MSHDFAFWESKSPLEDEEAGDIYSSLMEDGAKSKVGPSEKISSFAQEIESRWPKPARGKEDESPWAAPCEVSESHVAVFLVPSRLWDVWPILGELAKQYELVMYDPQQRTVFLPPRLSQKRTRERAKKKKPPDK